MEKFKRAMRLLLLICLIILAGFGIGLCGAVPIPQSNKREDPVKIEIELVEDEEENDKLDERS